MRIFLYLGLAAAAVVAAFFALHAFWRGVGLYRITRAGPRPLRSGRHVIWRDPGAVHELDLREGPGGRVGAPAPPFRFLEEHQSGSQPCVSVADAAGRRWRVKWGPEVRSENAAVRIAWACGYFTEVTHFVPAGTIEGTRDLQRARASVDAAGAFTEARFELEETDVKKMFEEHSWAWDDNPFVGSPQLNGLTILKCARAASKSPTRARSIPNIVCARAYCSAGPPSPPSQAWN